MISTCAAVSGRGLSGTLYAIRMGNVVFLVGCFYSGTTVTTQQSFWSLTQSGMRPSSNKAMNIGLQQVSEVSYYRTVTIDTVGNIYLSSLTANRLFYVCGSYTI